MMPVTCRPVNVVKFEEFVSLDSCKLTVTPFADATPVVVMLLRITRIVA